VKATFKHVPVGAHIERMTANGLPDHLAVAVTELSEALIFEENILSADNLVKGKDVSIPVLYGFKEYVNRI
jgi:hypothetical protein